MVKMTIFSNGTLQPKIHYKNKYYIRIEDIDGIELILKEGDSTIEHSESTDITFMFLSASIFFFGGPM